jgi:uncharacterized damage-inducible protein DinB
MTDIATIQSMFKVNHQIFLKAIDGIPEEQWLTVPDEDTNHLLWIAGHMVVARSSVPKMLGKPWSAPWEKLFVRGAKRMPREQYPSPAEIRQAWQEVDEKLNAALSEAKPEELSKPSAQGAFSLDGTVAGAVGTLCLHETYHVGQVGYLRKRLGYGQAVG